MRKGKSLLDSPTNVRFDDLVNLCRVYFGEPRIHGSHHVFKTPWQGDPRVNLQRDGSLAKPYQVKQVKRAVERWEAENEESD